MDSPLDEQILNAIELFHYSNKFRNTVFAIIVNGADSLRTLLSDLRVLQSSHIRTVVFSRASAHLERKIKDWKKRGHNFTYIELPLVSNDSKGTADVSMPAFLIAEETIPVVAFTDSEKLSFVPCIFYDSALHCAKNLSARKIIFPGPFPGLTVNNECLSHPSSEEVQRIITENDNLNLDRLFLAYVESKQNEIGADIIILEEKAGILFQEIFTHRGAGTLLSHDYPNKFRQAIPTDVADIALLMKPYIKQGSILPVSELQIFDELKNYYVYTVNDQVVASAKLTPFGDAGEIGKICTLPRYQRKGRARAITEKIIEVARKKKLSSVFSLSTQDRMFIFFRQLGFKEVDRESLPDVWKRSYDFSRPSKAFRLTIEPKS